MWVLLEKNILQTSKIVLLDQIFYKISFKLPKICSLEKHRTESVSTCPSASSSEFSNFLDPSYTWLKHVQLYLNYIYIFQQNQNLSMTVNTLNRSCSISLSKVRNCLGKVKPSQIIVKITSWWQSSRWRASCWTCRKSCQSSSEGTHSREPCA